MKARRCPTLLLVLAALPLLAGGPLPGPSFEDDGPVKVRTAWDRTGAQPGQSLTLAVVLEVAEPYHVNTQEHPAVPTKVEVVRVPPGVVLSTPLYPQSHTIMFGPEGLKEPLQVFSGRVPIYIPMQVGSSVKPGQHEGRVKVSWQACDDQQCLLPVDEELTFTLTVLEPGQSAEPINADLFEAIGSAGLLRIPFFGWDFEIDPRNLLLLLPIAALGGLLLNFTPCVLPLIPIKIMGLSKAAGSRRRSMLLGGFMAGGIAVFWLAIGAAIASISGFDAINKLFQYPAFTMTVGVFIAIMAVGMMGLFSLRLPQAVYMFNPSQETAHGSFLFGVMAAVLSTPCTAPFMGAAAAWATKQAPPITLATFFSIGAGMALPYLLLAAFPQLVSKMPRTGPASELIKQVMGLLIFAAAAFFLGTGLSAVLASPPDPPSRIYWWIVGLFIAAAGIWLGYRTVRITPRAGRRLGFGGLAALLVLGGVWTGFTLTRPSPVNWIYYTPDRLAEAQQGGKVVVLDFTAEWCLNCKAIEEAVLHRPAVYEKLNGPGVAPIKVDITNYEAANQKLAEVGSTTIPLLIVYDPAGNEVFRSDAYTVEQVLGALEKAAMNRQVSRQ
jgi:thiol:disulfide interchange protein